MIQRLVLVLGFVGAAILGGCAAGPTADISALAEQEPLPYSVLVTGGAFVEAPELATGGVLARTFGDSEEAAEAISLRKLTDTLRAARVFVTQGRHDASTVLRRQIGNRKVSDKDMKAVLAAARARGYDFLLVVEKIQDGAVQEKGINDRWPFTLGAWLFAMGWFIPDRTYESRARLHASLRDVRSGRVAYQTVAVPGPVNLNLLERASAWGYVQSILVPPFWTSVNNEKIVGEMRLVSVARLPVSLAAELKSADARDRLDNFGPARISVRKVRGGLQVSIEADEALSFVRLRLDLQPVAGTEVDGFQARLLASVQETGGRFSYSALLGERLRGKVLQVLVQTVTAAVASKSLNLADLR